MSMEELFLRDVVQQLNVAVQALFVRPESPLPAFGDREALGGRAADFFGEASFVGVSRQPVFVICASSFIHTLMVTASNEERGRYIQVCGLTRTFCCC